VVGAGPALDDEPVQVTPGEPDPDPAPRLGVFRQLGRDAVLEDPVQMGQPGVDDDRGDRQRDRVAVAAVVDIIDTVAQLVRGHARRSSRRGRHGRDPSLALTRMEKVGER
jgi:hypothetical protein